MSENSVVLHDALQKDRPPLLVASAPRRPPAPYKLPWVGKFTPLVAERILDEIAAGRTLARICIEECWAPADRTVYSWFHRYPEFRADYEAACRVRAENMAMEIVELADQSLDHDKTKLQIHARQWLASKLNYSRFGEKKTVETNVNATVRTVDTLDVGHLSLDEIHGLEALLSKTLEGVEYRDTTGESRGLAGAEDD